MTTFSTVCDIPAKVTETVTCPMVFGSWTYNEKLLNLEASLTYM